MRGEERGKIKEGRGEGYGGRERVYEWDRDLLPIMMGWWWDIV